MPSPLSEAVSPVGTGGGDSSSSPSQRTTFDTSDQLPASSRTRKAK